jgi:hypothetical protein
MVKNNYAFDYQYDWVVSRRNRLDAALRGTQDPTKVIIPTTQDELVGAERFKAGRHAFSEPLPFFAILNHVQMFVARSKWKPKNEPEDEPEKPPPPPEIQLPKEQTMFLLDPRYTEFDVDPWPS